MNILTVIVLLLIAVFVLNGYRRGFVRVFASMFFFVLSSVLVYMATPYISQFLKEYTPIYKVVESKCEEAFAGMGDGDKAEDAEKGEVSFLDQKKLIEELELPGILKQQLLNNNNDVGYDLLGVTGFSKYIAGYMANIILNILSFLAALLLVFLILRTTVMTLDIIANLPILHGVNRFLGLILGFAQGILVIWFGLLLLTVFSHTDAGEKLMHMVYESPILSFLYEQNIILKYLLGAVEKIL